MKILFDEIAPKVVNRPGGYTRILKTGYRIGDAAHMCMIELVDFNEEYTQSKTSKAAAKAKTRRGGGRPKKSTPAATEVNTTEATETVTIYELQQMDLLKSVHFKLTYVHFLRINLYMFVHYLNKY